MQSRHSNIMSRRCKRWLFGWHINTHLVCSKTPTIQHSQGEEHTPRVGHTCLLKSRLDTRTISHPVLHRPWFHEYLHALLGLVCHAHSAFHLECLIKFESIPLEDHGQHNLQSRSAFQSAILHIPAYLHFIHGQNASDALARSHREGYPEYVISALIRARDQPTMIQAQSCLRSLEGIDQGR